MQAMLSVSGETYDNSPSGCQCHFIRFGDKGIKVYRSREERDKSYNNQYRLSCIGLAPKCYFKADVEITGRNSWHGYAFETELADCRGSVKRPKLDRWHSDACKDEWAEYDKECRRFNEALNDLGDRLREAGCTWEDDHSGNVGFIDGRAVLVDCADDLFGSGCVGRACFSWLSSSSESSS